LTADLNWYDLYRPVYPGGLGASEKEAQKELRENRYGQSIVNGEVKTFKRGYTMSEYVPWAAMPNENEPILGDYFTTYMNREDVRDAFHVPAELPAWEQCSSTLSYHEQHEASFWIYPIVKQNNIRALFYSGDTDGAVPTYGSRRWIKDLNWAVVDAWRPWYTNE
jgi:hypothetical protein